MDQPRPRDPIISGARAVATLGPALRAIEECPAELADGRAAVERGRFRPDEDDRIRTWFARYLTARAALLEVIDELGATALGALDRRRAGDETTRLRAFLVAYAAACLLVRAGRFLVDEFAVHKLVQRKLNEAEPRSRIPRKQYTEVYRSLTRPRNAWQLREAMRFADERRSALIALADDRMLEPVVREMRFTEESIRLSVRRYLKARLRYRWHSLRRRRASAVQQMLFAVAEGCGRVIADMGNPFRTKRMTAELCAELEGHLRPGDVIITRRDEQLSNLFLPGYWPHASLYIGPAGGPGAPGIEVDADRAGRWVEPLRVLEARKDGVRFRQLIDTLSVDAVAVLRPRLDAAAIGRALSRAVTHEGKPYNFDFDFFNADRLVCTEVVYRAYDGLGIDFDLRERAGRPTLSAEDLIAMAVEGRGFEPLAVFGTPGLARELVIGERAADALRAARASR